MGKFYVRIVLSSVFDAEWRQYANISNRTCWLQVQTNKIRTIGDLMEYIKDKFQIADGILLTCERGGVLGHDVDVGILKLEVDSPIWVVRAPPKYISPIASTELPSPRTPSNQTDDEPVARTNGAKSPEDENDCGDHGFEDDNALADADEHEKEMSIRSEFLDDTIVPSKDILVRLNTVDGVTEESRNKVNGDKEAQKRKLSVISEDADEAPHVKTLKSDYRIVEIGTPSPPGLEEMLSSGCSGVSISGNIITPPVSSLVGSFPRHASVVPRVSMSPPLAPFPTGDWPRFSVDVRRTKDPLTYMFLGTTTEGRRISPKQQANIRLDWSPPAVEPETKKDEKVQREKTIGEACGEGADMEIEDQDQGEAEMLALSTNNDTIDQSQITAPELVLFCTTSTTNSFLSDYDTDADANEKSF